MMSTANNDGIYLYCVIPKDSQITIKCKGVEGREVCTMEYKDILVAVSSCPYKVYDLVPETILEHKNAIKEIMEVSDVVPFNFGNVLKSENDLTKFLDKTYTNIRRMLDKISGKIEVGLKVFIKNEYLSDEIENTEIKMMKKQIEKMDEKSAYFHKIELGKLVKNSLDQKQNELKENIFNFLKVYSSDAKTNDCSVVNMVLNSAFLIEKDKLQLFSEKLNEVSPPYDEKYIFKYTGPWPPYNFIDPLE